MKIVSPVGAVGQQRDRGSASVSDLRGKAVAFLNNGWMAMGPMIDQMAKRLRGEHGVAKVIQEETPISSAASDELLDRVAKSADVAIVGLAT